MGIQSREALECCKLSFMGHTDWNSHDENAIKNTRDKDQTQEISVENKDFISAGVSVYKLYVLQFWKR